MMEDEKTCVWCGKECLSPSTRKRVWLSWYHTYCLPKYHKTLIVIEKTFVDLSGGPRQPQCREGHIRTEENTKMFYNKEYDKWYPRCLDCIKVKKQYKKAKKYA
jgi:hypothetical protein